MEMEELLREIEESRCRLYSLAQGKHLVDPEVVFLSQELDRLLNRFYERQQLNLRKVG